MVTTDEEVVFTLISGTVLLLFFVVVVIVAVTRYQNRKQRHLTDVQRLQHEAEQLVLKTRLEVHEKTLTDVSREIHDNIGQILSVVKLNLHAIQNRPETTTEQMPLTIELVNNAIKDLRNLSKVLNAEYANKQPLTTLLKREVEVINHAKMFTINMEVAGDEQPLPTDRNLVVFRIAQECLQNVIKHAQASIVDIKVSYSDQTCVVDVEDNGIGFDVSQAKQGNGYTNLMARTGLIGAQLDVNSILGKGSKITLTVPLR